MITRTALRSDCLVGRRFLTLAALAGVLSAPSLHAVTLFQNGNVGTGYNISPSFVDPLNVAPSRPNGAYNYVYDDFVVGPSGWTVDGLSGQYFVYAPFHNFRYTWSKAYWEIHSDNSDAVGALIASGIGDSDFIDLNNHTPAGEYFEFKAEVKGLNLSLGAGKYWMTLAPISQSDIFMAGSAYFFLSPTTGIGGVNPLYDNLSYADNNYGGFAGSRGTDFTYGVTGVEGAGVPDQASTMGMLLLGMGGIAFMNRRQRMVG